MKRLLFVFAISVVTGQVSAQQTMFIAPGTPVNATADVNIVLNNTSIVNHGSIQQKGEGKVVFEGNQQSTVSGSGTTSINKILVSKEPNSSVKIKKNLAVNSTIEFTSGLMEVENAVVDLGTTGALVNESESSKLVATGSGYVQATKNLNQPVRTNAGNLGLAISSPSRPGVTTIKRGNEAAYIAAGRSAARYYEVHPENNSNLNATVAVKYFDSELNGVKEQTASVYQLVDGKWKDEGSDLRDAGGNSVTKSRVNSLSRIVLFEGTEQVKVWPNPVVDNLNLRVESLQAGTATLSLFDTKGALILSQQIKLAEGSNNKSIKVTNLASGAYSLQLNYNNKSEVIKLVKD